MRNTLYRNCAFVLLGLCSLYMSACKKSDSEYYNYKNTVQTFNGSALDYLKSQPNTFDSLLLVLNRIPALRDSIASGKITLFAPVNQNFAASIKYLNMQRKAEGRPPIYLSTADINELGFMTCKYIIRGSRTTDAFASSVDGLLLNSIIINYPMQIRYVRLSASGYQGGGPAVLNFSDTHGSNFEDFWTTTTTNAVNIKTNNATINILSPLHNFGFSEFTDRLDQ